jgi:hypothetical protein
VNHFKWILTIKLNQRECCGRWQRLLRRDVTVKAANGVLLNAFHGSRAVQNHADMRAIAL